MLTCVCATLRSKWGVVYATTVGGFAVLTQAIRTYMGSIANIVKMMYFIASSNNHSLFSMQRRSVRVLQF